jgi:SAM-dependent MidA family methyltransferase
VPIDELLIDTIHERGPLTVAAFMDLTLYHPAFGYYARAVQRSGRAGDFFTSVDVGPLYGELLARQVAEMARLLRADDDRQPVALVEAGAGNGRLAADLLRALRRDASDSYESLHLHLVEASAPARAAQRDTLDDVADCLRSSSADLPDAFEGVLLANELLDAMPVHQVVMRETGLREIYVAADTHGLVEREGPLSTPRLTDYFTALGVTLEPGWRAEVSLRAVDWIRDAVTRLTRGFVILVDYGHEARERYSAAHATGMLTSFSRHTASGADASTVHSWLRNPGMRDLTAHVDFTSIRTAAAAAGGITLGLMDQMYFLLALADDRLDSLDLRSRLAFKTLILPGGLGSTMKVLVLGKGVGQPRLIGCSGRTRLT